MGGYPPTLIFIIYQAFWITKHNKCFFQKYIKIKVTSSKIHLAQIHFHIALILPLM
jgi:hypothetical protein